MPAIMWKALSEARSKKGLRTWTRREKRDEHKGINERTEGEQRLAAVLREGLEQEIGEIPEVSINIDELKQLEAADRKTRKIKRLRTISVAAAAVIVCAAIIYTVLPESVVPVDADKNTKQKVEEKDGVVIIKMREKWKATAAKSL